jgi:uncharacterized protein
MMLPVFAPSIERAVRDTILAKLAEVAAMNRVRILFAIESGSRAWGFPSPDSDYDVRFVYAHEPDWYLSLTLGRDVIELPISDELDIAGWDIRKALNLLLKPNPVLLEWLSSPIRYLWQDAPTRALIDLAARVTHQTACLHHYLHLGTEQWRRHVGEAEEVNAKKYFYSLRPALALRWLRLRPDETPPMNFQALVEGVDLPPATVAKIAALLEAKAKTRELGLGRRIPEIDSLIEAEFAVARVLPPSPPGDDPGAEAEALFRAIVRGEVA